MKGTDHEWRPCNDWSLAKRTLIDGSIAGRGEHLMRRKVNGEHQYRRMTEDEITEQITQSAW